MIRKVWLAEDVCNELSNKEATLSICMNSVTQFMQLEAKKHGNLHVDLQTFDDAVCRITKEAIASLDPHLRSILGVYVRRDIEFDYGDVEVRFNRDYHVCLTANSGINRIH